MKILLCSPADLVLGKINYVGFQGSLSLRSAKLEWYKESLVLKICQFFVSKCGV